MPTEQPIKQAETGFVGGNGQPIGSSTPAAASMNPANSLATFPTGFDLAGLDGTTGFSMSGAFDNEIPYALTGISVSGAGDINNDGLADVIVAASGGDGAGYVVFGTTAGFEGDPYFGDVDLSYLDLRDNPTFGRQYGFEIRDGVRVVSSAGDVNADGIDDLIIGNPYADPDGRNDAGESYVIFGSENALPGRISLMDLDGSNGFRIEGINPLDSSGIAVSGAGDVNGDGIDDFIIGASTLTEDRDFAEAYVVFGSDAGFAENLQLSSLDGTNGFLINGINIWDGSGISVSGAGDINGDGVSDMIVGAQFGGDSGIGVVSGRSYVIFGSDAGFDQTVDVSTLDGENGFKMFLHEDGADHYLFNGLLGASVSDAGDINGDGLDDIVVGAPGYYREQGHAYVVFGTRDGFDSELRLLSDLDGTNGFRFTGPSYISETGFSVSAAGDFDGDGFDDLIVGAPGPGDDYDGPDAAGASYVIFGSGSGFSGSIRINGVESAGKTGYSVSGAGDLNGDGLDDVVIGSPFVDGGFPNEGVAHVVYGFSPQVLFRINAGGMTVAATDGGPDWSADTAAANSPFLVDAANNKVTDELVFNPTTTPLPPGAPSEVFESQRAAAPWSSDMTWAFDVPDAGRYQVNLFLREWWTGASDPGDRVFDVAVEGNVPAAFDDIDAASDFGFRNGGVVSSTVEVTDGTLDLTFLSEIGNPMMNAIEIVALDAPPPPPAEVLFRVNAGGMTVAATDGGPDWSADTAAANSAYLVDAANNKVTDELVFNPATTPLPPGVPSELFESQRAAAPWSSDMTWAFNVPEAGFFEVNLYLREFWNGASDPGDRVFDVAVEGNVPAAFDDIDAASDFGFRNGGRVSTTVEVTDGTLDLTFLSEVGNPMVNAIEIVALDAPPVDDLFL